MDVWITARGAGLAALVLLTITTCLGAMMSPKATPAGRVVAQYAHRVTATLGLGAIALHITTILMDSYAHVGALGAVVPFTSGYRATWVGLGTIAAYLVVIVAAAGFARGRMAASPRGAAAWRGIHLASYGAWGLAIVHGFTSGTDSGVTWVRWIYLAALFAVAVAVTLRLWQEAQAPSRPGATGARTAHPHRAVAR